MTASGVLIVRGAGRAFSAGFDLEESAAEPIRRRGRVARRSPGGLDMTGGSGAWPSTIPAVRGYCLAGAGELAVACDVTIAATDAVFGGPSAASGAASSR